LTSRAHFINFALSEMSSPRATPTPAAGQLSLSLARPKSRRGGKRKGAGRKPTGKTPGLPHRRRAFHEPSHPVHITMRAVPRLRSFRKEAIVREIFLILRRAAARGPRTGTFRVVHFSVQPNHLHLVVEAGSKRSLGRGLQGLASGLARRLNRVVFRRRGRLFADRYHGRALASPLEVRRVLLYVLKNAEKHPEPFADRETIVQAGIDPASSARWFTGWTRPPPPTEKPPPTVAPETWLLKTGWKRHGTLGRGELPAGV
jgi:REP element-mobilizing transposase RayT